MTDTKPTPEVMELAEHIIAVTDDVHRKEKENKLTPTNELQRQIAAMITKHTTAKHKELYDDYLSLGTALASLRAEKAELLTTCRMLLTRVRNTYWPRTTSAEKLDKIAIKRAEAAIANAETETQKEPHSETPSPG